ncbi:MAG TPA: hypothetical protein VIE43_11210 [Thermoanaerobaculia bacterium]|nr:hypothetical protein [Thermoanaerobaculia bacterium]
MQRKIRSMALGLVAGAALTMAAAAADMAAGTGVTFINGSNHHVDIYTRYGSDAGCDFRPNEKKVGIDGGQTGTVDSGSSSVCYCLKVPERGTCPSGGWLQVKAGGTRHLQ